MTSASARSSTGRRLTGTADRDSWGVWIQPVAVQEAMLRAWRASDSHEGRSSLRTWLFRIAHNHLYPERFAELGLPPFLTVEAHDAGRRAASAAVAC